MKFRYIGKLIFWRT